MEQLVNVCSNYSLPISDWVLYIHKNTALNYKQTPKNSLTSFEGQRNLAIDIPLFRKLIGKNNKTSIDIQKIYPYAPKNPASITLPRIFYNRIPKCGSATILKLIQNMAKTNNFTYIHSAQYHEHSLERKRRKTLVYDLCDTHAPWLYDRHLFFINFTHYGCDMPDYINLFREPLDRRRSRYYYHDFDKKYNMTFAECLQKNKKKNVYKCLTGGPATFYFCGSMEVCRSANKESLSIAKNRIDRFYKVVGVTEDMISFLRLLEHHYPTMFSGVIDIYKKMTYVNVDHKKHEIISDKTKRKMRKILKFEYELYDFILQRFNKQKEEFGI